VAAERFVLALRYGHAPRDAVPEARRLHGLLLGDLLDAVPVGRSLVVVAAPELAGLPWGFLEEPTRGLPLIARWPVAVAPDLATALAPPAPPAEGHDEMLVVANPSLPGELQLPSLPAAEAEAAQLARLFPGRAAVLAGERATRAVVVERIPRAMSVHFAVHGIADARAPGASYLLLRGEAGERAPLTAQEILRLDLRRARVVVLAACDSSLRSTTLAASTFGLGEAFLAAGARAVVASSWAVSDNATSRFMGDFYRALAAGETIAAALRAAQLAARAAAAPGEPQDHAAFRLLGDPSVTLETSPRHHGGGERHE
jgi:CHAT domain-containing protein